MRHARVTVNVRLDAAAFTEALEAAWEQARRAAQQLAHVCNFRAAEILRAQWPEGVVVEADLARHFALEGNPKIVRVLDEHGMDLFGGGESSRDVLDAAAEYLSKAMHFADETLAGWVQVDPNNNDSYLYQLALPEGLHDDT